MQLQFRDPISYQGAPEQVDSSALYPVGTIAKAYDIDPASNYGASELVYLKAGADDVVGSVVTYNGSYTSALAVANAVGNIAVSTSIKSANEYGWYVIKGNVPALVLASFAAASKCYLTATAGSIDDAVVAGDELFAAKSLTAIATPSAGLAVININNSFVMDGA